MKLERKFNGGIPGKVREGKRRWIWSVCIVHMYNVYKEYLSIFFFLYSFLCNTSWPQSPLLALVLVSPHILCLHFPLNIPGLPGITSRHGIIRCNKTRHKPSYLDWMRQCSSRKRIPQKKNKLNNTRTYTDVLRQNHVGSVIALWFLWALWDLLSWYCESSSPSVLDPSDSYNSSSPSSAGFPCST